MAMPTLPYRAAVGQLKRNQASGLLPDAGTLIRDILDPVQTLCPRPPQHSRAEGLGLQLVFSLPWGDGPRHPVSSLWAPGTSWSTHSLPSQGTEPPQGRGFESWTWTPEDRDFQKAGFWGFRYRGSPATGLPKPTPTLPPGTEASATGACPRWDPLFLLQLQGTPGPAATGCHPAHRAGFVGR